MGRNELSLRARSRNRRPRRQSRARGKEIQGRRSRRGRLHGRFLPDLRKLPRPISSNTAIAARRSLTIAKTNTPAASLTAAIRRASSSTKFRAAISDKTRSRRGRAASVRRNHDLLAAASLESRKGQKVGVVGLGGLGHMGSSSPTPSALSHALHHFAGQNRGREEARRARSRPLERRRRDEEAREKFRFHHRHRFGEARLQRLPGASETRRRLMLVGAPPDPLAVEAFNLIMPGAASPAR